MNCQASTDQDDGWTLVPRGKRRDLRPVPQTPRADRDLTLEKLIANYKYRMQIWRASTSRRVLMQILDRKQPENGWQIKQAVCFASGSFCLDNWQCQRRTMTQFVAFMDIVEHLQVTSDRKIGLFAQDPIYMPLDIEFLSNLSIRAQMSSEPTEQQQSTEYHLDSDSFVFEAFMDKVLPAIQPFLRSNVRLFIGTPAPSLESSRLSTKEFEDIKILYSQFDTSRSSYYFPTFEEDPNVFEGLRISWTNESEND